MEAVKYLEAHWLVITTIWIPALVGYWNGLIAAFKVMGWTRLADECDKLERAIQAFIQAKQGGSNAKVDPVIRGSVGPDVTANKPSGQP